MQAARSHLLAAVAFAVMAVAFAGCSGPTVTAAPGTLDMSCSGESRDGSPTVVLVPGLTASRELFAAMQTHLAEDMRVCSYSRAGIGRSPAWPDDLPDPSAGAAADQLLATLHANDESGPYLVLGWSYGGLVAQAFAARHSDLTAGMVLEDSATADLFDSSDWASMDWSEGGRPIDTEATADEVGDLDLGALPLIVLTQGTMEGWPAPTLWTQLQDRLATLSDNTIHVVATDAGHAIHLDAEPLVVRAIEAVASAARSGTALMCDDGAWAPVDGECRS